MMNCTIVQRHQLSIANTAMPELKNVNVISTMIAIAGGMKKMNNNDIPTFIYTQAARLERKLSILQLIDKAIERRKVYSKSEFYSTFGNSMDQKKDLERMDTVINRLVKYYKNQP